MVLKGRYRAKKGNVIIRDLISKYIKRSILTGGYQ